MAKYSFQCHQYFQETLMQILSSLSFIILRIGTQCLHSKSLKRQCKRILTCRSQVMSIALLTLRPQQVVPFFTPSKAVHSQVLPLQVVSKRSNSILRVANSSFTTTCCRTISISQFIRRPNLSHAIPKLWAINYSLWRT